MSSDMFSSGDRELGFEPWYEKEQRTWLEFRKGCKGRIGIVCYIMDAKLVCREDGKDRPTGWTIPGKDRPPGRTQVYA